MMQNLHMETQEMKIFYFPHLSFINTRFKTRHRGGGVVGGWLEKSTYIHGKMQWQTKSDILQLK